MEKKIKNYQYPHSEPGLFDHRRTITPSKMFINPYDPMTCKDALRRVHHEAGYIYQGVPQNRTTGLSKFSALGTSGGHVQRLL